MVIQIDDEFIGYIYRFTESLDTKIVGVHDVLKSKLALMNSESSPLDDMSSPLNFNPNIQSMI
jgi:hypothetical protein